MFDRSRFAIPMLIFSVVAGALGLYLHATHPSSTPTNGPTYIPVRLVFEIITLIVFLGMNSLYILLWKDNAVKDYFEPIVGSKLPPPAPPEYRTILKKETSCPCGFDLEANPNQWQQSDRDLPQRCPDCGREIFSD